MTNGDSPLVRVRQPAYMGENRCYPYTAANLVIAVGLGAGVALVNAVLV